MKLHFVIQMTILCQTIWNVLGWEFQLLPTKVKSEGLTDKAQHNITITDDGGLSLYINLKEDLHDLYMTVNLAMNFDTEKDNDIDVIKRTVNCCQLFKESSYATEVQFFYKILLDHGHFPVKCPVKKDLYYIEDLKVDPERLPALMTETNAFLTIKFSVREKNRFKILAAYQLYFSVKKIGNATDELHTNSSAELLKIN